MLRKVPIGISRVGYGTVTGILWMLELDMTAFSGPLAPAIVLESVDDVGGSSYVYKYTPGRPNQPSAVRRFNGR
jgi:hypothetical protein